MKENLLNNKLQKILLKDNKPAGKSKLKLMGPIDKRDFKLTVSRALNVEEIDKQRSLASVKRARLKEKKRPDEEKGI